MDSSLSKFKNSFRRDIFNEFNKADSSCTSMSTLEHVHFDEVEKYLEMINGNGRNFVNGQIFSLCNLLTQNYLHTHKIKNKTHKRYN
jgi:hypothetical protein